jgi:VanZ like family
MLEMQAPAIGGSSHSQSLNETRQSGLWEQSFQSIKSIMRAASVVLIAYWLLIFIATHLPQGSLPSLSWSDKVYHCGAFTGLTFLLCWAIPSSRYSLKNILVLAALAALTYGALDELTQKFIPGRTCDIFDFAADSVGVGFGVCSYVFARSIVGRTTWLRRLAALP